uniref:Uncharacterized protein n=1 Tax=Magallana gigas TaxID=29159 RepID=K1PD68_MAGGI
MSWSLESSENGIFLLINGLRALDLNGTAIGSIETAKPGRNATEIWISDPSEFKEEHLHEKTLYTLGGNHVIQAIKRAIEEEPTNAGLDRYK